MNNTKQILKQQQKHNEQLLILLLFLVALAVAPFFRGLYFETEFLVMGIVVLGCCLAFFLINRQNLQLDYIDGLCFFLCLSYLLSIFNAVNIREAYIGVVKTVVFFSCYYLTRCSFRKQQEKMLVLKTIVYSLSMISILTVLTRLGIVDIPSAIVTERFSGTLQYANTYAAAMILAISLTYYLEFSNNQKGNPLYVIINYVNTAAFFSTGSRGAFLIYLLLLIFYMIYWRRRDDFFLKLVLINGAAIITSIFMFKLDGWAIFLLIVLSCALLYWVEKLTAKISRQRQIIISIGMVILGSTLVLLFAPGTILSRLTELNFSSQGVIARFVFYKDAIKIFQTSPLIGHGAECWEYLYRTVQTYYYNTKLVHSNLFQLLIEVGLLGTVTYYALFVVVGLKNVKAIFSQERQLEVVLLITIIALQLHALIDFDFSMPAICMFVFVLLGLLAGEYNKGIIKHRIMKISVILFVFISFISAASFFIARIGVNSVIAQVKDGRVQVDKIAQHQNKLKTASILDPFNAYYRDYFGQYIIAEGMEKKDNKVIEKGLKKIDNALKLSPYDYHLYIDKGKILAQLDRYEEACNSFRKIIDLMPYHQTGYEYLIRAYTTQALEKKDVSYAAKAVKVYKLAEQNFNIIPAKYLQFIPEGDKIINSGILNFQMGAACFLLEKYEDGLRYLELALRYINEGKVVEEIKGWIAVGNQKLNSTGSGDADPAMVKEIEKLLEDFRR